MAWGLRGPWEGHQARRPPRSPPEGPVGTWVVWAPEARLASRPHVRPSPAPSARSAAAAHTAGASSMIPARSQKYLRAGRAIPWRDDLPQGLCCQLGCTPTPLSGWGVLSRLQAVGRSRGLQACSGCGCHLGRPAVRRAFSVLQPEVQPGVTQPCRGLPSPLPSLRPLLRAGTGEGHCWCCEGTPDPGKPSLAPPCGGTRRG